MTNLVTEVERAIEAAKRGDDDEVGLSSVLMRDHGPAILAAVKLAESCFVGRWGDSFDKRQLDAYRAALRTNQQSGDGK